MSQALARCRIEAGLDRPEAHAVDRDAVGEAPSFGGVDAAVHAHAVAAQPAGGGQFQLAGQGAVVGQQQQALAVQIEPADADHARQVRAAGARTRWARPSGSLCVVTSPSGLW